MTVSAYPEVLHEEYRANPTAIENLFIPAGTYALRRTFYLNKIKQELLSCAEQQ